MNKYYSNELNVSTIINAQNRTQNNGKSTTLNIFIFRWTCHEWESNNFFPLDNTVITCCWNKLYINKRNLIENAWFCLSTNRLQKSHALTQRYYRFLRISIVRNYDAIFLSNKRVSWHGRRCLFFLNFLLLQMSIINVIATIA